MHKPSDPDTDDLIVLGVFAIFSGIGGIIGYLSRTLQSGGEIRLPRAILEGCSAAFIGLIVTFLCEAMHLNMCWTGAFVGVSGWMGATASVKIVEMVLSRRLGLSAKQLSEIDIGTDQTLASPK